MVEVFAVIGGIAILVGLVALVGDYIDQRETIDRHGYWIKQNYSELLGRIKWIENRIESKDNDRPDKE